MKIFKKCESRAKKLLEFIEGANKYLDILSEDDVYNLNKYHKILTLYLNNFADLNKKDLDNLSIKIYDILG